MNQSEPKLRGFESCPISTRRMEDTTTFTILCLFLFSKRFTENHRSPNIGSGTHTGALVGGPPSLPLSLSLSLSVEYRGACPCLAQAPGAFPCAVRTLLLLFVTLRCAWFSTAPMSSLRGLRSTCADVWRCFKTRLEMGEHLCAPCRPHPDSHPSLCLSVISDKGATGHIQQRGSLYGIRPRSPKAFRAPCLCVVESHCARPCLPSLLSSTCQKDMLL